ncbi:hypothetical protein OC835_000012 [Tilletia horrida]|uniref:UDP-glycosyltransferases domain-containing protein n=1 Tax=Tilletia horrida TaxID=155126 RepID=A0AAN6GHT2_9BASI|nr:hypothetical protein OC842_000666 [Tilletia horrida]KAK0541544.1 hypothetical protein OC835_000012 [Tilletia horrida]KAK0562032.1 hypothetical protein OC844_002913 [Tilletia horrida]
MKFLFVSNPAHGQINNLMSIAHELVLRGHDVHVCTGDRLANRVNKIGTLAGAPDRIHFHGCGSGAAVDDLTVLAHQNPELFHSRARHPPGELVSYLNLVCEHTEPGGDNYRDTCFRVRDVCNEVRPDMIIVDNFSPFAVDGVRLSKQPYIISSPGAACAVAKDVSPLKYPLPLCGADGSPASRRGFRMVWNNLGFIAWWLRWCLTHPWPKERRAFRKDVLGLEPVDIVCDSFMTPVAGTVKENVAGISFNVAGLDLYPPECYHKDVFFVGPCYPPVRSAQTEGIDFARQSKEAAEIIGGAAAAAAKAASAEEPDPVKDWLDAAQKEGAEVIYINMGSIFYYTAEEYEQLVLAVTDLHDANPSLRVLLKVPALGTDVQPIPPAEELPPFIRRESWLPSIQTVLEHPVVKVAVHHGGGNSFNEALSYGLPQFVLSQWGETHDIAAYVRAHEIGVTSDTSPRLVREDIVAKLDELLRDYARFKRNCNRWQLRTIQAGGTRVAADIIELHARQAKDNAELEE